MPGNSISLNMTQRRDKLRTQGDIFDESQTDFLFHTKEKNEQTQFDGLGEPNLGDVEAMMHLHGVNTSSGDVELGNVFGASSYETDQQIAQLNDINKQLYDPNSAQQLFE